ncbi:MAG: hypothetical protein P4L79_07760, partial [Legionella sp.]|uniref:hypothetical protein n=1 Tax=Legionella sp. TaxID=459 RepID=UPI0028427761|nr:hypothetical protein [Legionella sp.]
MGGFVECRGAWEPPRTSGARGSPRLLSLILYTLNQMIKKTHIRSIKSGDILEIFMYKKPLYRGFTIAKKKP